MIRTRMPCTDHSHSRGFSKPFDMKGTEVHTSWAKVVAVILMLLAAGGCPGTAHADRASENMDPAWMFEKAEHYELAAMYYQRAVLGLREVYCAFHWNRDPANYGAGKYAEEYSKLPVEMESRYKDCLEKGNVAPERVRWMTDLNDLWLSELIDQEQGGQRTMCEVVARVAERHGDFILAQAMRTGQARFCRVVGAAYHQRRAEECEKAGELQEALLHRQAVKAYEGQAYFADKLAEGDKVLRTFKSFAGPDRYLGIAFYPAKVNPVSFQNLPQRLFDKQDNWKGKKPEEVAAILRAEALSHADENVRYSAVNVLADLGEKEAVRMALADAASEVRLLAAGALARFRWAEGWAACAAHTDPGVRAVVQPLLTPAGGEPLLRTWVIGELVSGLNSPATDTRTFCQTTLETITGQKLQGPAWADWWKKLGDARPGLARTGPGVPLGIDPEIDFGAWWQSSLERADNPLTQYAPPAKVTWSGYVAVSQAGDYRFYVRSCGEKRTGANMVKPPGRIGFPGLYLSSACVKMSLDGKELLPRPTDTVQDPNAGTRLDFSNSIRLAPGLHKVELQFDYRSTPTHFWTAQPSVRLYWSSDHFLRELVPAENLVTKE